MCNFGDLENVKIKKNRKEYKLKLKLNSILMKFFRLQIFTE